MGRSRRLTSLAPVALAALALAQGCVSTQGQSERRSPLETRLVELEAVENYENLWRAASLCAELSDEATEHRPRNQREAFGKRGMLHAERAIALQPDSVEGHYYRALCMGRYLDAELLKSFTLVTTLRDEGERAVSIDPGFEFAGPHRFLAELYAQTPEWGGPWAIGDKEKAELHYQKAVELCPGFPENHLLYAKFLVDMERFDRAAESISKARGAVATCPGLDEAERERLRQRCDELAKQLPQK